MAEDLKKRRNLESKKNRDLPLFVLRMERLPFIAAIKNLQSELPPFISVV